MKTKCGDPSCSRMLLKYEYCHEHEIRPCIESGCKRKRRKDGKCGVHCGYKSKDKPKPRSKPMSKPKPELSHATKRQCKSPGCPKRPYKYVYCEKHGRRVCSVSGCDNLRKSGDLCSTHAYKKITTASLDKCIVEGCSNAATNKYKCKVHALSSFVCNIDDCKEESILEHRCLDHIDFSTIDDINFWIDNL